MSLESGRWGTEKLLYLWEGGICFLLLRFAGKGKFVRVLNWALPHEDVWGRVYIDPYFLELGASYCEWSASRFGRFTPGERVPVSDWVGGWVDPRSGLDDMKKRKFLTLPGLKLRPLGRPHRNQSLYRLCFPGLAESKFVMNRIHVVWCSSLSCSSL
jgi:hypothetical protein